MQSRTSSCPSMKSSNSRESEFNLTMGVHVMLTKALGLCLLGVAALIAFCIAGFIFTVIWKVGMVALVGCGLYYGWQLLKS